MISKTISVCYEDVRDAVILNTNYVGAVVQQDGGTATRMFATEYDNDLFDRLWTETAEAVADGVKEFQDGLMSAKAAVGNSHYCQIPLSLPSNWNTNYETQMQASAKSVFVNTVTSRWFGIAKKDETGYYDSLSVKSGQELKSCIYARKKPRLCDV